MLNYINDAKRRAAMVLVREGRLDDVSHVLDESGPVFPGRYFRQALVTTAHRTNTAMPLGENQVNWVTEIVSGTTQVGTHLDALSHLQIGDRGYNGWTVAELAGPAGMKRLGAETIPVTSRTCRPPYWPTAWPGALAEGRSTRPPSSGYRRSSITPSEPSSAECMWRSQKSSRSRPLQRGRPQVWACMRQPTGRRCRCCGSKNLRGACRVPRSRGSSPATYFSAWLWYWAVGALAVVSLCGPELRDLADARISE
jgi:hypothetical protein